MKQEPDRAIIQMESVKNDWATRRHSDTFWKELGKTIATFGMLEEVLMKAAFAFSGTQPAPTENVEKAVEAWVKELEISLSETLGALIDRFQGAKKNIPTYQRQT